MADKDYLISVCKKLEDENKINNKIGPWYDLDNMDVNIYTKKNYIVVDFVPKNERVPGIISKGGGIAYYFTKTESEVISLLRLCLANRIVTALYKGSAGNGEMEKGLVRERMGRWGGLGGEVRKRLGGELVEDP